jgi:DNA topoisomerase-3
MEGKTAVGCSNYQACGFKIPYEMLGKKLTEKQLLDLIQKGKTSKIKGLMIPGSAQVIEAALSLDDAFNVTVSQ